MSPAVGTPADCGVVIAAAGSGSRYGARKQFLELRNRPLIHFSLDLFSAIKDVGELAVVGPAEDLGMVNACVDVWSNGRSGSRGPRIDIVAGGERRQDSVLRGIEALSAESRIILVHDAARPLTRVDEVKATLDAIRATGAAALGHPVTDSIKEERDGRVVRSLQREHIWVVQTPQGGERVLLERAYSLPESALHTDEVSLFEAAGIPVALVEGSRENIKVTLPGDLELAEFLLSRRALEGSPGVSS